MVRLSPTSYLNLFSAWGNTLPSNPKKSKQSRLDEVFSGRERIVVLAADHRYFGVVSGLECPREVLSPLLPYVDALMTDPGVLRHSFTSGVGKPVILRSSGCSTTMSVPV